MVKKINKKLPDLILCLSSKTQNHTQYYLRYKSAGNALWEHLFWLSAFSCYNFDLSLLPANIPTNQGISSLIG